MNKYFENNKHLYFTIRKMLLSKDSIKNFIIKYYIPFVNQKFNEYFRKYSFPFQVVWDNNFDAKLYGSNYEDLDISNLSTGQRKAIDLSLVFTFSELQSKIFDATIGLSFYDEICTGLQLDKFDTTLDILKDESKNKCIFITEQYLTDFTRFDKVYEVINDNGSKLKIL